MNVSSEDHLTNIYDDANEFIATKKLKTFVKGNDFSFDPQTGKSLK